MISGCAINESSSYQHLWCDRHTRPDAPLSLVAAHVQELLALLFTGPALHRYQTFLPPGNPHMWGPGAHAAGGRARCRCRCSCACPTPPLLPLTSVAPLASACLPCAELFMSMGMGLRTAVVKGPARALEFSYRQLSTRPFDVAAAEANRAGACGCGGRWQAG